ncbi:MAG: DUF1579 domain-containing protein [Proteobacteria bacterium]|nr:DUF1579 domain-containing protein [Pseudomonadota bacterium]
MSEEQMAAWMEVATPSQEHKYLERMVGTWKARTTFWMEPNSEPQSSEGTMTCDMILGGRFLQSSYEGQTPWGPFAGMAIDGYDRIRNKYTGVWMDSMGTIMMAFEGECSGDVRTMRCDFIDPLGKPNTMKAITTIISDNEYTYETWGQASNGEMFKNMAISYTR